MEQHRDRGAVTAEDVATIARLAGLRLDPERLDELAALLASAVAAADHAAVAASRTALADALDFDPAWSGEGSGS